MSKVTTESAAALVLARRFAQAGQFASLLQVCADITGAAASAHRSLSELRNTRQ